MNTGLVIEDNPTLRDLFRKVLAQVTIETSGAGSCREALDYLNTTLPEVVLLDLALPDGNGAQVIDFIRQSYASEHCRIIVISGNSNLWQTLNMEDIDFILYKPVVPTLLLHTLRHLPARHDTAN